MQSPATQPTRVSLAVASASDPGLEPEKQINEDAFAEINLPIGHLLVVCDGMGGHAGGKEASEAAIRTIVAHLQAAPHDAHPGAVLKEAIARAGKVVYDLGGPPSNTMRPGSTAVAILCHPGGSEIAHVGDSRAYLVRESQIHPITRDHSMVQEMVDAGVLRAEDASRHPEANKITRALGMAPAVDVELRPTPLVHQRGDVFLLASDGLSDLVTPTDILSVVLQGQQARSLDLVCKQLVALANARGGHDNITVLIGQVMDCPTCQESRAHTMVGEETVATRSETQPYITSTSGYGGPLHPTIVDEVPLALVAPAVVPGSTGSEVHAPSQAVGAANPKALVQQRKLKWLIGGVVLVLLGIAVVFASVVWAWMSMSDSTEALVGRVSADASLADGTARVADAERWSRL